MDEEENQYIKAIVRFRPNPDMETNYIKQINEDTIQLIAPEPPEK